MTNMLLMPQWIHWGISNMLVIYGIASVIIGVVFFAVVREHPPTPPCPPEMEERALVYDGLKQLLRKPNFWVLLFIFFIGLGVFNAVATWIEDIVRPRGFSILQAGTIGGLLIGGGIVGALILPTFSDRSRKRIPFIILSLAGAILGLIGLTYATSYWLLLSSAFVLGFFLLSAGPIGFQYGAEIAYPTPEGTSNGLLLLMGQISGIIFILGMDSFKSPETGSMTAPIIVLVGLMGISLFFSTRLKESILMNQTDNR
jgi:sugar phosphate permease